MLYEKKCILIPIVQCHTEGRGYMYLPPRAKKSLKNPKGTPYVKPKPRPKPKPMLKSKRIPIYSSGKKVFHPQWNTLLGVEHFFFRYCTVGDISRGYLHLYKVPHFRSSKSKIIISKNFACNFKVSLR